MRGAIQEHLGEVVPSTVEETLNAMLDAEGDRLCRAERYERSEARQDARAGRRLTLHELFSATMQPTQPRWLGKRKARRERAF